MKTAILILLLVLFRISTIAQAPQAFSYQTVVRDLSGSLMVNKTVTFRISILQGSAAGTAVYSELHSKTTNDQGLVDLEIGKGNTPSGSFTAINWGEGTYFVKVEIDPAGGTEYQETGTSQLLSVPYALHAHTSESAKDAATQTYVSQIYKLLAYALQGVQDADGNHYNAVMIGDQVWMAENLKTTKYNDGTVVPLVSDQTTWANLTSPGYCWYNNDAANKSIYGALYNGYTVQTGKLCPAGWHVPTMNEFLILKNYLIANGYNYDGSTTGNKIAKSMAATTRWTTSTYTGSPGNVLTTNNNSGFSALPGGLRAYSGVYYYIANEGYWWSSTIPGTYGNLVSLHYASTGLGEPSGPVKTGLSVRCLKD